VVGAVRRPVAERFEEWTRRYPDAPLRRAPFRLPIVLWRLGVGLGWHDLVVLTVTGRSSGLPRHTPVLPHVVGGRTYVWCPWGGRSQWYRNMMADPVVTVQSRRQTQVMRAVSIEDDDEMIDVISDLRRVDAPYLRLYLDAQSIADTPEDIIGNKQRLHVRRLESTLEEGPAALEADLVWLWLVPIAFAAWSVWRRCSRRRLIAP
jgi:deazaflavin-dependent oxidoreductase (nitroreductase family)